MAAVVYAADEDPLALAELAQLLAQESDCELRTFSTPDELRAAASERTPDAVIADGGFGGDGMTILDELAAQHPHLVALVAVREQDSDAGAAALVRVGPLRRLSKPFEPNELLAKLTAGLEQRQLALALEEARGELQHRDQALRASRQEVERATAELATTHTELATATERLVESEQLAAVGRVLTGIAHEIGTQLALVGYAEAIKTRVAGDPELSEFADIIVTAQRRLAAMVEQIRDFASGHSQLEREPADLAAVVDEALGILRYDREVRARNVIRHYHAKPLCALHHEKFIQVVINLVTNAVLATESGDTIRIDLSPAEDGPFADLIVSDEGSGMPPQVLARLGEPFFTTRPGRGSGLGVGICMRIVAEHGGELTYESSEGQGTRARVRLPVLPEPGRARP